MSQTDHTQASLDRTPNTCPECAAALSGTDSELQTSAAGRRYCGRCGVVVQR